MKYMGRMSVVGCNGAGFAVVVLAAASFSYLLGGCTSGTAAQHDAGTCGASGTNIFQGFNWLDGCTTMLGGSANITVNDGMTTDQCIPASACAMREIWQGEFFLQMGIDGFRGQGEPCELDLWLPLDSSGGISDHQYTFDPSLEASPDVVVRNSYYGSGYDEGEGLNHYPAPEVPVWTGTSTIECFPPVGGMLRGTFIYDGTDLAGAQRKVNATFSVPRYPDFEGVIIPDGGVP